jgi:hypothetical protein
MKCVAVLAEWWFAFACAVSALAVHQFVVVILDIIACAYFVVAVTAMRTSAATLILRLECHNYQSPLMIGLGSTSHVYARPGARNRDGGATT